MQCAKIWRWKLSGHEIPCFYLKATCSQLEEGEKSWNVVEHLRNYLRLLTIRILVNNINILNTVDQELIQNIFYW